ncbi:CLUMA_CG005704, isoform B [Clunio marinus]|uniref:CLUMA_CG005704, isoform B n=1 Tax=Clunio marinus TaxID=568069 RepID=A0A1J1HW17_9DIPT|nr:CLUMA_CG005704, isoform B [Clunio marinus]
MSFQDSTNSKSYVCPSDRQLALRAKLQTGWSSTCKRVALNAEEQRMIVSVIKRNEQLEMAERQRVGKLVERTGAWFYKGLPNYEIPCSSSHELKVEARNQPVKVVKTTKLGMEIDSDEDEDDGVGELMKGSDQKSLINGSFSNTFLKSRNLFNLRLTTDIGSKFTFESNSPLPKKSPVTPFSRQTSSSDSSQKSANSLQPQANDWENGSPNGILQRQRQSSFSSSVSIPEVSSSNDNFTMNRNYREPVVLGWLEVSVNYDESQDTLFCTILRARDLPPMDSQGLSDPFCKVNIITPENTLRHTRWQKSRIAHKTNNPEFNETFTFIGMSFEDMNSSNLFVVLLDDDKYGSDFLGATKISLGLIQNCSPCKMTIPLGPEDRFSMESLSRDSPNGQILIALCYNTQKRALAVVIKRCINLMAMDKNGLSDPFVKIQLRPDSNRKKFKTSIKWRNLNPVFNEEFFFETRPNDLDKQTLIITVWDRDIGKSNDFLGSLILGQISKGRRLKQWKDCIILPDQYHEQWHFLSSDLPHHH